jgi:membrane-bound lytic murein transglycosylase D
VVDVISWSSNSKTRTKIRTEIYKKYDKTRHRIQPGIKEKFAKGLEIYNGKIGKLVHEEFKLAGLPMELALLPHVESSYDTKAMSKVKATGLFQIMPFWIKSLGLKNTNQLKDPVISAKVAAKLFKIKHDEIQYWPLTITAWNQGLNAMIKAQKQFGNNICQIVEKYEGKHFGYSGQNFFASFLAVVRIVEKSNSSTYKEYK